MYGKNVKKIKYWGKGEETMKKKYRKLAAVFAAVMALGTLNAPISGVFAAEATQSEAAADMTIIQTDKGMIQGLQIADDLVQYRGVPYAAPPVGDLRWAAPEDHAEWEGILDCTEYQAMAMQILSTTDWWGEEFYYDYIDNYPNMSEDCLYINITSPATSPDDNLPVLFWMHGGANMHGFSYEVECNPEELARRGVIVVEVEYRLGLFGYMATTALSEDSETGTSGNYALMDCIKALEWIQTNIENFGGDPTRVTIAGQSAGAGMVSALITSPLTDGLFTGAIMNSSFSPFGTRTPHETTVENCEAWLEEKGYGDLSLEELRDLPTSAFMNETTEKSEIYGKGFGICLDGYVLTEDPVDFYSKEGSLDGINLLFGSNSGESNGSFSLTTQEDFFASAKERYGDLYDQYNFEELFKTTDDMAATMESLRLSSQLTSTTSRLGGLMLSELNPDSNIYMYYFSHWTPGREEEIRWSWHSSELWYVFDSMRDVPEQRDWTELDYQIGDMCSTYWANFCATGNPNGGDLPVWTSLTMDTPYFMEWGDEFKLRYNFYDGTKNADRDHLMVDYVINTYGLQEYFGE